MSDGVIVLHGIFRTYRSMSGLARNLEKAGYEVLNLGYPSTKLSIEELVEYINEDIERFSRKINGKIHFAGYSMGGLLVRAYINKYRPKKLGRVVMIATPNNGSEIADLLKDLRLYHKLYGPSGQQLITDQKDLKNIFGKVDYELGIIAGDRPVDMISSRIIGKPNDGKVSIESTKLENMKDHIIIRCNHTYFPASRKAHAQAINFLAEGRFRR